VVFYIIPLTLVVPVVVSTTGVHPSRCLSLYLIIVVSKPISFPTESHCTQLSYVTHKLDWGSDVCEFGSPFLWVIFIFPTWTQRGLRINRYSYSIPLMGKGLPFLLFCVIGRLEHPASSELRRRMELTPYFPMKYSYWRRRQENARLGGND
jgi:hypothetical protein